VQAVTIAMQPDHCHRVSTIERASARDPKGMFAPMLTELFLAGRVRHGLTDDDLAALDGAVGEVRKYANGDDIIRRGERVDVSTYLIEGFVIRSVMDREGGRQILGMHVPGDFLDLHAFPLKRLDHDVSAIGECTLAMVPHHNLRKILEERPNLTRILWYSTLLDAAAHREWIFRLGRLDALGRVCHFLCETEMRLRFVGMSDGKTFPLPLSQREIADVCGITSVHMSRTMAALRRLELVQFDGGNASILHHEGLAEMAEFDGDYLYGRHGRLFDDKYDE
jgi:CRP-like cAMP-binding protein